MLGNIFQPAPPVMMHKGSAAQCWRTCCTIRSTAPAMDEAIEQGDDDSVGNAWMNEATRSRVSERGVSLWLKAEVEVLLARGYAMAGTTRLVTGWDVEKSIANQLETIDRFTKQYKAPARVFVLGSSLGAHTGAATIQARPDRFAGAVLMCGGLAGSLALWQSKLDAVFVAKTLIAPGDASLPVIGVPNDFATTARPAWLKALAAELGTAAPLSLDDAIESLAPAYSRAH